MSKNSTVELFQKVARCDLSAEAAAILMLDERDADTFWWRALAAVAWVTAAVVGAWWLQ